MNTVPIGKYFDHQTLGCALFLENLLFRHFIVLYVSGTEIVDKSILLGKFRIRTIAIYAVGAIPLQLKLGLLNNEMLCETYLFRYADYI